MSDIEEKRKRVRDLCDVQLLCSDCPCFDTGRGVCCTMIEDASENELNAMLVAFGGAAPKSMQSKEEAKPQILDSGERTEYSTGAVRDCKEGKGRCDLMPLDVLDRIIDPVDKVGTLWHLDQFRRLGNPQSLVVAIRHFATEIWKPEAVKGSGWATFPPKALLEVSKHFEEGAKKYGPNNWQKGIPVHSYIDSAVRHYLKFRAGWTDEPHDRAFVWNLMCCIWTMEHHPELDDFTEKGKKDNENH